MKILFLLRQSSNYGSYSSSGSRAGLANSARYTKDAIVKHLGVEADLRICFNANKIDREVSDYKPAVVILEALWVTPVKLAEIAKLHPKILFVVRIHSEVPFLAHEGIAIEWIKGYLDIYNVTVGFNTKESYDCFTPLFEKKFQYLPNIYEDIDVFNVSTFNKIRHRIENMIKPSKDFIKKIKVLNIGCFGAIRPMKNHLFQAFVAIQFGNLINKKVFFHINVSRLEHGGESVLKNLRALFKDSTHELVEHGWLKREEFLELISTMTLGMQLSFNESFNIVTADFVQQNIPIVVSEAIDWMPNFTKTSTSESKEVLTTLFYALNKENKFTFWSRAFLNEYNRKALKEWSSFLYTLL